MKRGYRKNSDKIDPRYFRPTEVDELIGDPSKAFKKLNWKNKISLEQLVKEMISYDKTSSNERIFKKEGFNIQSPQE